MLMNSVASSSHKSPTGNYSFRSEPLKENYTSNISKRVLQTYKKFKEKPLPPTFKTRLDGPPATWEVFNRLQMAADYADTCTKGCMVFSFEDKASNDGQRMFLVTHPKQMWQKHRARQLEDRCSYEVIRENFPCKLYFDLEFYSSFNSQKNGNIMTEIFIRCIIAAMFDHHHIHLKKSNFLWLDASNELKFSSHLILQMKNIAFQTNAEAGIFVSLLTSSMRNRMEENKLAEDLWPSADEIKTLLVKSKKGKEVFFCDEGVYTKNRNFRIFLATKHGKKSPLVLSKHNEYVPYVSSKDKEEETIFNDSLITYFRDQEINKLLKHEDIASSYVFSQASSSKRVKINGNDVSGFTLSPFPNIDNFVLTIIKDDFVIGFIRKWTYFCNEQKIFYDIGNYRFCSNIGRHHKSNNIRIIVDMKSRYYYQTCLDPDCRQESYRSEVVALPHDIVLLSIPDDFFDDDGFPQTQCEEKNNENCDSSNHSTTCLESVFWDDNVHQDLYSNFSNFSQHNKINCENNAEHSERKGTENSWDAFFAENLTIEDKDNQDVNEVLDESFFLFDEDSTWNLEPVKDSTVGLGDVSLEEELLMAEAVEATEIVMHESTFSEETVF